MTFDRAELWLIERLARGGVVPLRELRKGLPGFGGPRDNSTVLRVRIWSLRQKLGRETILNIHSKGYELSPAGMAQCSAILGRAREQA